MLVMTAPSRSISIDFNGRALEDYARRCGRQLAAEDAFEGVAPPHLGDLVVLAEAYLRALGEEPPADFPGFSLSPRVTLAHWTHAFLDGYRSLSAPVALTAATV
jgi:hypothetical protein